MVVSARSSPPVGATGPVPGAACAKAGTARNNKTRKTVSPARTGIQRVVRRRRVNSAIGIGHRERRYLRLGEQVDLAARNRDQEAFVGELDHREPGGRAERHRVDDAQRAVARAEAHAGLELSPKPERADGQPEDEQQHDDKLQKIGQKVQAWHPRLVPPGLRAAFDPRHPRVGGDLIATQFAAYQTYAAMLTLRGETQQATVFRKRAQTLQTRYERTWWDEASQRFASFQQQDGAYHFGCNGTPVFFPLAFGLVQDRRKALAALASEIAQRTTLNVEERSYLPELFYNYGHAEVAYAELVEQMHPTYARREYPEVSFAALGNIVTGLMGIAPDARTQTIATCPRLTAETPWVTLRDLPVFANQMQVTHRGCTEPVVSNLRGEPFQWQAKFSGEHAVLWVDGKQQAATCTVNGYGQAESWVLVTLEPGATKQVQIHTMVHDEA